MTKTVKQPLLFDVTSDHPLYQQSFLYPTAIVYTIPGKPIPLQRPRYSRGHIYDSQKLEKNNARIYITNCHGNNPQLTGPLQLIAEYYFEAPKRSKKLIGAFHSSPPDLDNLLKWTGDCAQEITFANDCTIAQILATKIWSTTSGTRFTLKQLKG